MGTNLSSLVPDLEPFARELVRVAGANGLQPRVTSARRTIDEQRALYDRYLRGINPYPVAPPGTSAHETGEAFDMLVTPVEYLQDLGAIWQSWGGVWGGNGDPVHFQLPGAPSPDRLAETKGAAATGNYPSLWDYIGWALDLTSLYGLLFDLGYTVVSRDQAEKVARALHIDPHGRIF